MMVYNNKRTQAHTHTRTHAKIEIQTNKHNADYIAIMYLHGKHPNDTP
jgi:hypothetical protein